MLSLVVFIFFIIEYKSSDIFEEYYEKAREIMSNMTIEQKIGQLFFPRFNITTKNEDITKTYPGGYVLFAYDFENKTEKEVINNIKEIQKLSNKTIGLPLGLAVDEEGGTVNRVSLYFRKAGKFPSPQQIYNELGIEGILKIDKEKIDLLKKFKLNVNLAPVADISYNSSDYIYPRTLGKLPNETSYYIQKDVEKYQEEDFTCCLKHFPGYGNNVNTHTDVARDTRPYETFLEEDFKTFEAGIKEKVPMILVSHNIVECNDTEYPASLSGNWHKILRNDLNYSGLILTDDLSMDAIKKYAKDVSPAVLAVNAANDILITSEYYTHLNAVINATKNKNIDEETINTACTRVIAWKLKYLNFNDFDDEDGEDDDDDTVLVICSVVGGIIFFGILFYFISKHCFCKNSNEDSKNRRLTESF